MVSLPRQDILIPSGNLQLILGDPNAFPGQGGIPIPQANSVSAPGSPPSETSLESFQGKTPRGHPEPLLASSDMKEHQFFSEPAQDDSQHFLQRCI